MGPLTAYSLYTAFFLLAGYLIYKWLMASEKQIAFNRWYLLGIYAIAFAAMPVGDIAKAIGANHEATIGAITAFGLLPVSAEITETPLWPSVVVWTYLAGMAAVAAWSIIVMVRLAAIIRRGEHYEEDGYTLVVVDDKNIAPFSWSRYVVMTRKDFETAGTMISAHELAHISHRHWIDLLVAQAVCILQWFNPAAWLLREELKSVHEYQADDSVLAGGVDAREYQLLLIKKAVGIRFHSIANSLNHSNLKKRITMMYNQKTSGRRRLAGLALVPALAVALAVTNLPAVASVISGTNSATLRTAKTATVGESKVTQKTADTQTDEMTDWPDVLPSFPGGEAAMYKFLAENMVFPKSLEDSQTSGRVIARFTVQPDGSIGDIEIVRSLTPDADAELIRVIKAMPKWIPAVKDGKAVASTFALPATFKLSNSEPKKELKK